MRSLILLAAALMAGCTPTAADTARAVDRAATRQEGLARELAGLTPDAQGGCFSTTLNRGQQSTKAYGNTLLFRVSRNLVYRTDTAGGCEGVGDDKILVTSTPSTQFCRGDIATTIDRASNFPSGGCSFGDFVAYRRR